MSIGEGLLQEGMYRAEWQAKLPGLRRELEANALGGVRREGRREGDT